MKPQVVPATKADLLVAFPLQEVQEPYDNPTPFAQRQKQAATFEEHRQQVYLNDEFIIEQRA